MNDAPVAQKRSIETYEDAALLSNLMEAIDVDSNFLTLITTNPLNGSLEYEWRFSHIYTKLKLLW